MVHLEFSCFWTSTKDEQQASLRIVYNVETASAQVSVGPHTHTTALRTTSAPVRPVSVWDLYLGAEVDLLGRKVTLRHCSGTTLQWLQYWGRRLQERAVILQEILATSEEELADMNVLVQKDEMKKDAEGHEDDKDILIEHGTTHWRNPSINLKARNGRPQSPPGSPHGGGGGGTSKPCSNGMSLLAAFHQSTNLSGGPSSAGALLDSTSSEHQNNKYIFIDEALLLKTLTAQSRSRLAALPAGATTFESSAQQNNKGRERAWNLRKLMMEVTQLQTAVRQKGLLRSTTVDFIGVPLEMREIGLLSQTVVQSLEDDIDGGE
ncbi:unnamed protein product [Amoebophrya sp. A25]|nr:unnamed protein product [Amoebophrya sp. A25]|eukprot:GSA25T00016596001.1